MENPEAHRPPEAPWLFGFQGLAGMAFVLLVAAAVGSAEATVLVGCLLLVGLVARAWSAASLRRIGYTRTGEGGAPRLRAFRGDTIFLETRLSNRKAVPLPWVEVWERYPSALGLAADVATERSLDDPSCVWVCQGAAMWPYQRARWRLPLTCRRRGVYHLPAPYVRTGDPFGLFERERQVELPFGRTGQEVVVYPRVVPLRRLGLPLRHPSLDVAGARSLVTDPTRTAALRAYQPGDPLRLVHWATTARRGSIQVRVLEPATSLQVSLVLDVRGFSMGLGLQPERESPLEVAISALASIAVYLSRQDAPVGVYANTDPPLAIAPGGSADHLEAILESFARLHPLPSLPMVEWLLLGTVLPRGSTVVMAVADGIPDLDRVTAILRAAGHPVVTLLCGWAHGAGRGGQEVVRLTPESDLPAVLEGRLGA